MVAKEWEGGYCAIQCKLSAPHRPMPKRAIDAFIAAPQPSRHTSRPIVNDPNDWFADHLVELVSYLYRLVHVSVETAHIVDALPLALRG